MPTDNEFEDFFREQLDGLEEAPPAHGFFRIQEELKPWYVRYRRLAAAVLIFLLSIATFTVTQIAGKFSLKGASEEIASTEKNELQTAAETSGTTARRSAGNTVASAVVTSAMNQNKVSETDQAAENKNTQGVKGEGMNAVSSESNVVSSESNAVPAAKDISGKERGKNILPLFASVNKKHSKATRSHSSAPVEAGLASVRTKHDPVLSAAKLKDADAGNPQKPLEEPLASAASVSANPGTAADTLYKGMKMLALRSCLLAHAGFRHVLPDSLPVALAASSALQGEGSDSAKTKVSTVKAGWAVTAYVSPRVTFGHYAPNKNDGLYLQSRMSSLSMADELSYEGGVALHRNLSRNLSINVGLNLTSLRDKVRYAVNSGEVESLDVSYRQTNAADVQVNYRINEDELNTRCNYAGLSLGASYILKERGDSRVYATGGGMVHMLVNSQTNIYRNGVLIKQVGTNEAVKEMNRMNGQLYAGIGFAKNVSQHLALSAEPAVGYFLGSVFRKAEMLQMKPYTFGVNIGLHYDL